MKTLTPATTRKKLHILLATWRAQCGNLTAISNILQEFVSLITWEQLALALCNLTINKRDHYATPKAEVKLWQRRAQLFHKIYEMEKDE